MSKSVQHVQKHPKGSEQSKVSKKFQICVICPKLSRGVQNTKRVQSQSKIYCCFFLGHPVFLEYLENMIFYLGSLSSVVPSAMFLHYFIGDAFCERVLTLIDLHAHSDPAQIITNRLKWLEVGKFYWEIGKRQIFIFTTAQKISQPIVMFCFRKLLQKGQKKQL